MSNDISLLAAKIIDAELDADKAQAEVDRLKAELVKLAGISQDDEGAHAIGDVGGYKVTITCKINRTVDGDKLQSVAYDAGLSGHLSSLFRWKPSINMSAWRSADSRITAPLLSAITAKAGKPAVKIEKL